VASGKSGEARREGELVTVRHYQDLIAWQKAIDLVTGIYRATEAFPRHEVFGLRNQIRRAAVSIPSNIAEGQARDTTREFLRYLAIARGSLQELETQILIASRLVYLNEPDTANLIDNIKEVGRLIGGLTRSLASSERV
jgi:four helix bundle protein